MMKLLEIVDGKKTIDYNKLHHVSQGPRYAVVVHKQESSAQMKSVVTIHFSVIKLYIILYNINITKSILQNCYVNI